MPPRQEKRGRGRGKRPRDEEEPSSKTQTPRTLGFSAINSPSAASSPQARYGQQAQAQALQPGSSSSHAASRPGPPAQQSGPGSLAPPGKVAIPALKNPRRQRFRQGPQERKMTKLSRESVSLSRHNDDVTDALRRIRLDTQMSTEDIRGGIGWGSIHVSPDGEDGDGDGGDDDEDESALRPSRESSLEADEDERAIGGNEDLDMEGGSTGSLDVTNTNTDRDDTRATGHLGKSSSVAWAKRTIDACQLPESATVTTAATAASTTGRGSRPGLVKSSYHTEDADVEYFGTSDINCFDWPAPDVADALVGAYFATVHPAFPIVDKVNFMAHYSRFDRASANLSLEDLIWLGTVNTIFAISAVHAHLTRSPGQGPYGDHLVYVARAKALCLDHGLLYEDARVHTTAALGLLCLYFIATCRVNRAWAVCGLAIRQALTLGLHVRSEADDLSDYDKEVRVRLWWSLYSLECLLNELTGRPSCISDRDISTPLPLNINEEDFQPGQPLYDAPDERHETRQPSGGRSSRHGSQSPKNLRGRPSATYQMPIGIAQPVALASSSLTLPTTTSTYFIYRTQLAIISHEIVTQLYCAAAIKEKWVEVQDTIRRIDGRLRAWRDNLPEEYSLVFDLWEEPDWRDPHVLPRMGLAMLFNSSRMILFRPCLCKFEGRITTQSERSMDFNQQGVQVCIHSARTMINLIGWTARNVEKLYSVSPWWHTLHYLCEALSVLMLELAYQAQHLPAEAAYMLDDAKKGVRWLIMMSEESISARKAWEIFDNLIRMVAPRINWSVFDLPTTAPVPLGYNWQPWRVMQANAEYAPQQTIPQQMIPQQPIPPSNLPGYAQLDPELDSNPGTHASGSSASPWAPRAFGYQPSSTYGPSIYGQELVSNPLDQDRAVQMFGSIGALHGHYDEPWYHMFVVNGSGRGVVSGIQGDGTMGPPPPPDLAEQGAGSENIFVGNAAAGEFDPRFGSF